MPRSPSDLRPILTLALLEGIGPSRLGLLIRHFGSADAALGASGRELALLPGIGREVARRITRVGAREEAAAARAAERLNRARAVALTPDDAEFPDGFRTLADPPYLLFASGNLPLMQQPALAVVGTRSPTLYGRETTLALAGALARAGYTIVSGMARGIDTAAHEAALEVGGSTIGVLGHGIELVYPPENRALFGAVREHGLLITEFVPGETPKAGNFPRRNRLIVALSQAVLVVEMGLKSGAQHTVTYALEQGREVMAVPGPVGSPASTGTNQLIKDGARLVTSAQDVLEELGGVGTMRLKPGPSAASTAVAQQPVLPLLSTEENRVLGALARDPMHVDQLCASAGMLPGSILGTLLELELKGLAQALPGMHYRRT